MLHMKYFVAYLKYIAACKYIVAYFFRTRNILLHTLTYFVAYFLNYIVAYFRTREYILKCFQIPRDLSGSLDKLISVSLNVRVIDSS